MLTLENTAIPTRLATISQPPSRLFTTGSLDDLLAVPCVAIVGSRKVSAYGREVTQRLASELAGQGITIISGLAFGVDSIAHQAALDAGGRTIAVLPSPIERVYPASHQQLAKQIVARGGALLSEYPSGTTVFKGNFVARNRLIAGLADATLLTEAALKSGSLHTARFALESGRDVLAVPGNITSPTSCGTNNLLKMGATPVTGSDDILQALHLVPSKLSATIGNTPAEQAIIDALASGIVDGAELQQRSGLTIEEFNQTLTMLEINGAVRGLGLNRWSL
jgi:DNA processing protein